MPVFVKFAVIDGKIKKFNDKSKEWDNSSRSFLEKQADEVNVVFTNDTSDEDLVDAYMLTIYTLEHPDGEPVENPTEEESEPVEFIAWQVAIDIHNGKYGAYRNQQQWAFDEAGFADEQVEEALAIAETIN